MRRSSWLSLACARASVLCLGGLGAFGFLLGACSTHGKAVPLGGECFQATDCGDGVVCVPQADGKRICSTDISGTVSIEDAGGPPPADAGDAGDAGPSDAGPDAARTDAAPKDAAPPDSEPPDTGASPDAAID